MRRILTTGVCAFAALALTGCSARNRIADCPTASTSVERFSLCLPDGWHQVTDQFGEAGSFIVQIQPPGSTGALMQIHVKKDPLQERVRSTLAFAERAVAITRERAPNYAAVRTEPITVSGQETILHVFDASPGSSPIRYYQFVTTNSDIAYGFTATIHPSVGEGTAEELIGILKSVRF